MDNKDWFREQDEEERIYAPQELPVEEQGRVLADEGRVFADPEEPPTPGVVVGVTGSSSGIAAVPEEGHTALGDAPGAFGIEEKASREPNES